MNSSDEKDNSAGRFFVLVCAVVSYALAVIVYFHGMPGFGIGVLTLGGVGTLVLALTIFASSAVCSVVAQLLSFGVFGN